MKKTLKKNQRKFENYIKKNPDNKFVSKIYFSLIKVLRPIYFKNEYKLLKGSYFNKNLSNQKSIIFFSVHKSASTFIKKSIIKLIGNDNIVPLDFSGFLDTPLKQENVYNSSSTMEKILIKKGHFYGAIRNFYEFPEMEDYKVLLVLRDPRDVLTSHYFSTMFNHPIGKEEIISERNKYKNYTIDEFVLDKASDLQEKYQAYAPLIAMNNVLFLKYEDMISDFENWLLKLCSFLNIENETVFKDLVSNTKFKVDKENPNSFIRNVKAGDHLNKLKPETITRLNKIFEESLNVYGY